MVLLAVVVTAQGLLARLAFEPTSEAVFRGYVGGRLVEYAGAASVAVVLAVAVYAGTRRAAAGVVLLVVAAGVLATGEADAYHRLRYVDPHRMPDLLTGYPAPAGATETPLGRSGPKQIRMWTVPEVDVCATAQAAFLAWAGPGATAEDSACRAHGRRGEVVLTLDVRPGAGSTTEIIVTAGPSYGT
jgi:hypothetical protein